MRTGLVRDRVGYWPARVVTTCIVMTLAIVAVVTAVAAASEAPAQHSIALESRTVPGTPELSHDSLSANTLLLRDLRDIYAGRIDVDPGKACILAMAGGAILLVDDDLFDQANTGPRSPAAEQWGQAVTDLGTGAATLGISGLIALRDPRTGYLAANAVIYSGISCAVLKALFGRARPEVGEGPYAFGGPGIREGYNSMPSGHSAAAFALATVLARQYPKYRVLFYSGATLVAISRVYVGAHWPSDTLIGAAIGVWSANQVMGRSRILELRW